MAALGNVWNGVLGRIMRPTSELTQLEVAWAYRTLLDTNSHGSSVILTGFVSVANVTNQNGAPPGC